MNETWVDSHVHYHECFSLAAFLQAARQNLLQRAGRAAAVLLMTQHQEDPHPLNSLRKQCHSVADPWTFHEPDDDHDAILASTDFRQVLVFIAGRQLVTKERLEVLALCTSARVHSDRSLRDTLQEVRDQNGIAVLPWGFGKWWFRRGQQLRGMLEETRNCRSFLLGDNGGRPTVGRRPRLLSLAERLGVAVIAGSDPLPLPGQEGRVGSYGTILPGAVDLTHPTAWVRDRLRSLAGSPATFGGGRGLPDFVSDQVRLRISPR